jgi:RNA polymerase sigma factor (sigma-70 family)
MTATRSVQIALLYARHADTVYRLVARRVGAPPPVVEDACQTAWERLCSHDEVELDRHGALWWLVVTAVREVWKRARHPRELPVDRAIAHQEDEDEGLEPAGPAPDPCDVALAREQHRVRVGLLKSLTGRERRYLGLQAIGLSYGEIAALTDSTRRTVERQIERGRRKLGLLER